MRPEKSHPIPFLYRQEPRNTPKVRLPQRRSALPLLVAALALFAIKEPCEMPYGAEP